MQIQIAASAVPARAKANFAGVLSRTAPKRMDELRRLPVSKTGKLGSKALPVDGEKPKKALTKLVAPDVSTLKSADELLGKLHMTKFKDESLKKHFRGMDVCKWYEVNGEPALIVGLFIPTHKNGTTRFAQMNSKTKLASDNLKVSKYMRKGGTIELLVGKDHILMMTYAA